MTLEQLLCLQLNDVMDQHQRVGARLAASSVATAAAVAIYVAVAYAAIYVRLTVAAFAPGRCER